jgi:hypothetical protein
MDFVVHVRYDALTPPQLRPAPPTAHLPPAPHFPLTPNAIPPPLPPGTPPDSLVFMWYLSSPTLNF